MKGKAFKLQRASIVVMTVMAITLRAFGGADAPPAADETIKPAIRQLIGHLESMRAEVHKEIDAIAAELEQFLRNHPEVGLADAVTSEVVQLSQAYVAAQLATIDARTRYSAGHPALHSATKKEADLLTRYKEAAERHVSLNASTAQIQRLKTQSQLKQDVVRMLNERILQLHELSALIDSVSAATPPTTAPASDIEDQQRSGGDRR